MSSLHVQPDTDFKLQFVWCLVSHNRAQAGAASWYSIVLGQGCSLDSTQRKQYISHCIKMLALKVVAWALTAIKANRSTSGFNFLWKRKNMFTS